MTADLYIFGGVHHPVVAVSLYLKLICLLYTSDAADD